MIKIEHLNITVPDIDAAIQFLQIIAPSFQIRKDESPADSYRWVHIGNEDYYIALQEPHLNAKPIQPNQTYINYGVNHIGLEVANISLIEGKLKANGYKKGQAIKQEKFRKRAYYYDQAGN